jgi:hypothetical protein
MKELELLERLKVLREAYMNEAMEAMKSKDSEGLMRALTTYTQEYKEVYLELVKLGVVLSTDPPCC